MTHANIHDDVVLEKQYAQELMAAHPLNMDGWAAYAKRIANEGHVAEGLAFMATFIAKVRGSGEAAQEAAEAIRLAEHRQGADQVWENL